MGLGDTAVLVMPSFINDLLNMGCDGGNLWGNPNPNTKTMSAYSLLVN